MRPGTASWHPVCRSLPLPHLVVLHHALQHWPGVLKYVCHALEERNTHNAEKAHLQENIYILIVQLHQAQGAGAVDWTFT